MTSEILKLVEKVREHHPDSPFVEELCVAIEIDKGIRCAWCKSDRVSSGDSFYYRKCFACGKVSN